MTLYTLNMLRLYIQKHYASLKAKETMNLREIKGVTGRVGGKKGKEKTMSLYFNFKKQKFF